LPIEPRLRAGESNALEPDGCAIAVKGGSAMRVRELLSARVVPVVRGIQAGLRTAAPVVDLWVRLGLAKVFFVSGMMKIGNWPAALELPRHGYPVGWLEPHEAALIGIAIAVIGPVLLTLGFLVRPAALAMLALSLVIQFSDRQLDVNLLWAALFLWYVVFGAGALSLDRILEKGLRTSAVPFAAEAIAAADWLTRVAGPWYLLLLRLWLAAALIKFWALPTLLPMTTMAAAPPWFAQPAAVLLALGAATPLVAGLMLAALSAAWAMQPAEGVSLYAPLLLSLLTVFGAGRWSVDRVLLDRLRRRSPPPGEGAPHVVILGAGFGGMACAARLRGEPVRITLIDRRNYHLFQPLLYQVATASLSPGDIAAPIRAVFRDDPNVDVLCATVSGVDPVRRKVFADGQEVGYDYLVLATGASHGYFGHQSWADWAPGLKFIDDAVAIRGRILAAFERAEAAGDAAEQVRLLTFLICGGGPTGVELAGAIAELARHGLEGEFRRIDPAAARVVLVQAGPRILPAFPEKLSAAAQASLQALGVEVILGSRVEGVDRLGAIVDGTRIPAATVLWAAGVVASPAARWLGAPADAAGRLKVAADLSVPGWPEIFAVGDTALARAWNGMPVPGLAAAAKQGGHYVAAVLRARLRGKAPPPPFRYRHLGSLATIGRKHAVADFGRITLSGGAAWWIWGAVHIFFLVGVRNRVSVIVGWLWSYLTYRTGVRLITGEPPVADEREGVRVVAAERRA
jgi:putative oxidoreductase